MSKIISNKINRNQKNRTKVDIKIKLNSKKLN